jgi:hypothetical protein
MIKSKEGKMGRECSMHELDEKCIKIWLEILKRTGRPRYKQANIKTDLKEMEWGVVDWIYMAEDSDQS